MNYFLGLDLSLTNSGICIIDDKSKIIYLGNIETNASGNLIEKRFERYKYIKTELEKILFQTNFQIKVASIENYSYASKGRIIQLVESGSLVRDFLLDKTTIIEVSPISLKKFILGSEFKKFKGKDAKLIMCREVYKKYNINIDENNQLDAFLLSQVALLYDKIKNNLNIDIYFEYQKEVVNNIIKKQEQELRRYQRLNN